LIARCNGFSRLYFACSTPYSVLPRGLLHFLCLLSIRPGFSPASLSAFFDFFVHLFCPSSFPEPRFASSRVTVPPMAVTATTGCPAASPPRCSRPVLLDLLCPRRVRGALCSPVPLACFCYVRVFSRFELLFRSGFACVLPCERMILFLIPFFLLRSLSPSGGTLIFLA